MPKTIEELKQFAAEVEKDFREIMQDYASFGETIILESPTVRGLPGILVNFGMQLLELKTKEVVELHIGFTLNVQDHKTSEEVCNAMIGMLELAHAQRKRDRDAK
jgi:hypothetical protein